MKMRNCFLLCKPCNSSNARTSRGKRKKVIQIVKGDGKILEYRKPILVKDVLLHFSGSFISVSKEAVQHLHQNYELKMGRVYYLLPSSTSLESMSLDGLSSMVDPKQSEGVRRIKVVITRQQLKDLLSKQISIEEVLLGVGKKKIFCDHDSNWTPKLEAIPEGRES
ncbi:PADRE domain [Dillenia turbinata]|uniref:PADRE domain n=1 Tax=Dillenia turbinata TaxID=194707 RepID=A0AAN8Z5X2_9MAGN